MLPFVQQFPIRGGIMKELLYLMQDFDSGHHRRPYNSTKITLRIHYKRATVSTTEAPQMLYRNTTDALQMHRNSGRSFQ
ncbi:hypothetical protein QW71_32120 [Paenibacillus sp. IHB B 3415]|nr:hypothetical protein QW71_32120 [Paenibacillus sp. IHB B 3415]